MLSASGWDKTAFALGSTGDIPMAEQDHSRSITPDELDQALSSPLFWSYRAMASHIAGALQHLMHWCEGCRCHSKDLDMGTPGAFQAKFGLPSCPLKARRAPEVALGSLEAVLEASLDQSMACLSHDIGNQCSLEDRRVIIDDFETGRQHLAFILRLKLSSWQRLPLAMVGMAHHEPELAKAQMQRCLDMFDSNEAGYLHPLCDEVLAVGSRVREQIEAVLLLGAEVYHQEDLCKHLARWATIVVTERFIEGRHAAMKKTLRAAPHHGPSYVAFHDVANGLARELPMP